jgi:hypothetical protein
MKAFVNIVPGWMVMVVCEMDGGGGQVFKTGWQSTIIHAYSALSAVTQLVAARIGS